MRMVGTQGWNIENTAGTDTAARGLTMEPEVVIWNWGMLSCWMSWKRLIQVKKLSLHF